MPAGQDMHEGQAEQAKQACQAGQGRADISGQGSLARQAGQGRQSRVGQDRKTRQADRIRLTGRLSGQAGRAGLESPTRHSW